MSGIDTSRRGRIRFVNRLLPVLAIVLLGTILHIAPVAASITPAYLEMNGDPSDYFSSGASYSFSAGGGDQFSWRVQNGAVQVTIINDNENYWYLEFAAPHGAPIVKGQYLRATLYPLQSPSSAGLSVSGEGQGCGRLAGSFKVKEATYAADGTLERFDATFEQYCEEFQGALRGHIRLGIDNPIAPLEDVPPLPASLILTGDPGDPISGGQNYSYSSGAGDLFYWYTNFDGAVNVYVDAPDRNESFGVTMAGPEGSTLQPGTYDGVMSYGFRDPGTPGLDASGNGLMCSTLTGSFTVHDIQYGKDRNFSNTILYLHATFEQHCHGAEPALRGEIRVGAPPATTEPEVI